MISFKQFLSEETISDWRVTTESIAELIKRDCMPYLEKSAGKFMYRGYYPSMVSLAPVDDLPHKIISRGKVRKDRAPKDSPLWLHTLMNQELRKKSGIDFRSASLFTVGRQSQAENYGVAHLIFPIGDFHYAWSEKVADPTHEFYMNPVENSSMHDETTSKYAKKMEKQFFAYLKKNRPDAWEYMNEIGEPSFSSFLNWAAGEEEDLDDEETSILIQFIKEYIPNNDIWQVDTGLERALSPAFSDHEIMIACDSYYAINTSHLSTTALKKFLK